MRCLFVRADNQPPHKSSYATLCQHGAPGKHWGQCLGKKSLQLGFQHHGPPFSKKRLTQRPSQKIPPARSQNCTQHAQIINEVQNANVCIDRHCTHVYCIHKQSYIHIQKNKFTFIYSTSQSFGPAFLLK